jgi:hypothetical protein
MAGTAFSEMVTFLVGPEEAPFTIHKNTLCEASAFSEDACFDVNTTIKLPEDDPDAVQIMLYWIYHNKLCMPMTLFQIKNVAITDGMNTGPGLLAKVFVLGEKYQVCTTSFSRLVTCTMSPGNVYVLL